MPRSHRVAAAFRAIRLLAAAFLCLAVTSSGQGAPTLSGLRPGLDRNDRVVVKLSEGSEIRLRDGRWVSLSGATDVTPLQQFVARHPQIEIRRHFTRSELELDRDHAQGEARSGRALADLNLYYQLHLPTPSGSGQELDALLAELRGLPLVETAFVEPIAAPAGRIEPSRIQPEGGAQTLDDDPSPPTPDYTNMQGYLGPSPNGVNAQAVWAFPGGRGASVKLIDIEGGWLWGHEDLPAPFFEGGTQINDLGWRNHGTAVLGEVVGKNNGFGVTGIASDVLAGCCSIGSMSVAAAIDLSAANIGEGDLFLIELHAPGPNANGSGQFGYVAMEWWQDNFDAIQTAVANGRVCIEAGGNGEQDLDAPVYAGLFDREVRDSGAILVGAGTPTGHVAEWFTNYGSRIDLNGWGSSVTTCGYGTLQGGPETQWYTSGFGGTSSASPIVTGAVACLQGMSRAEWGVTLDAKLAAQILAQTGTPWVGAKRIGPRPNLVAARALLLQGVGTVSGVVRDAVTSAPIPNAELRLVETGAFLRSDENGVYAFASLAGNSTIEATEFFHDDASIPYSLSPGQQLTLDLLLTPSPIGSLAGTVRTAAGVPLLGARIELLETPLPTATSGFGGGYSLSGIPAALGYSVIAGGVASKGAVHRLADVVANNTVTVDFELPDAQTFEASNGAYSAVAPWQWGMPSGPGPGAAFSGLRVWATNLSGNYGDNQSATLTSPNFDFSGAGELYLSFSHWYDIEAAFDGGTVEVHEGDGWTAVEPFGGYPNALLDGLGGASGYSGASNGWVPAVFDLTPFISSTVQIRFRFGSDGGVTLPGWYLDDVCFDTGPEVTDVAEGADAPRVYLGARPNPSQAETRLSYALAHGGDVSLRIVAAAGRRIRTVLDHADVSAGAHETVWDGRDEAGRPVARGAYFATLTVRGSAAPARASILLVR